jgi:hypothetical protein
MQEGIARESGLLRRTFGAPRNDAANSIRPEYALVPTCGAGDGRQSTLISPEIAEPVG